MKRKMLVNSDQFKNFSHESSSETDGSLKNVYLGIHVKRDFGVMQLMSLPILNTGTMMIGVYMNA